MSEVNFVWRVNRSGARCTAHYGRPVMDMAALGEYADANGGRDMSLEDWLREHSSYPLDRWEFYLGIEGAKDNG